ncbi:MAG: hypothetical protein HY550_06745, partial [Elusimicrobia bacterium]|nr:hypothetical protein [Elusimicrobiota bacterium]
METTLTEADRGTFTGKHLIGGKFTGAGRNKFRAVNPATGKELQPGFSEAGAAEAGRALELADKAFD